MIPETLLAVLVALVKTHGAEIVKAAIDAIIEQLREREDITDARALMDRARAQLAEKRKLVDVDSIRRANHENA